MSDWSDADFDRDAVGNLRAHDGTVIWKHGIDTIEADVWASVLGCGLICYAPVMYWRKLLPLGSVKFACGNGVPTARGIAIVFEEFAAHHACRVVTLRDFPTLLADARDAREAARLASGAIAETIVMKAAQAGALGLYCQVDRHRDKATQLRGIDMTIAVSPALRTWEVKYDGPGGPRDLGGTGNLFVQTHTRNPPAGSPDRWQER